MPPVPGHSRETIERAGAMYREGARVRDICAAVGMSVGALYHHLDGLSLPGPMPPRLPRRREVHGNAERMPSRGRRRLAARLFRAAEQQARKIEMRLAIDFQRVEEIQPCLTALRDLTRVLKDLSALEDSMTKTEQAGTAAWIEHEQALAVEGRAVGEGAVGATTLPPIRKATGRSPVLRQAQDRQGKDGAVFEGEGGLTKASFGGRVPRDREENRGDFRRS